MRTLRLLAAASLFGLSGCMAPPSPAERITDAAMALNVAARFNQLDVAVARAAKTERSDFMRRHAAWGQTLRIVDVEMASLSLPDSDRAIVLVDYAWVKNDEGTMRATRVEQHWKDDAGWHLVRERRLSGDVGLLGEPMPAPPPHQPDKQFATRTIHEDGAAVTE
ncbi:MAG: hypothetical protein EOO73_28830 [Myxococcales bacterium]|nr:MAG: hypothetical protein EOO73_28830 [Myxococcales bacterium]